MAFAKRRSCISKLISPPQIYYSTSSLSLRNGQEPEAKMPQGTYSGYGYELRKGGDELGGYETKYNVSKSCAD